MKIIVIYLIINIVIVLILRKDVTKQERLSNLLLSLFVPIIGLLLVLLLHFTRSKLTKKLKEEENTKKIILFTDRMNVNKDLNIISIEESLIVNDTKEKRKQILEVLKTGPADYIDILNMAIGDKDRETAHYAATALSEVKRNLDIEMQKCMVRYSKENQSLKFLIKYEKILYQYLTSNLIDNNTLKKYRYIHISVIKNILNIDKSKQDYYTKIINDLIKVNELDEANMFCSLFIKTHEIEEAYLIYLKYYYFIKDKKNFEIYFKELLDSSIVISNKGLNIIRFWIKR